MVDIGLFVRTCIWLSKSLLQFVIVDFKSLFKAWLQSLLRMFLIDFTNYSFLPNRPVSMLTHLSVTIILIEIIFQCFPWTKLFLVDLRLNKNL